MALIVQKYGGTSVGSIERIREVARRVLRTQAEGHDVVVVVSAMSGETNRLISLANQIRPEPYSLEYDMLIASGEQVSVGLLCLAINTESDRPVARPLLVHQIGIRTNSVYSKARIQSIDTRLLRDELGRGMIPVIAGFQGVDPENNITTLGRGGSDTSAVAIAAALKADECEIYTDVDGVYTVDPRLCRQARKIGRISYEEMTELAGLGAKVLQIRSVELAAKYRVPVHVRSSFEDVEGTRVIAEQQEMERVLVSGLAAEAQQVKLTLRNLADRRGMAAKVFGALAKASVVVDVIVQDVPAPGKLTISFTVGKSDLHTARRALEPLAREENVEIAEQQGLAKVSVVGVGMRNHPGVAARMFELLAEGGIDIELVTTSEIKISCLIVDSHLEEAVNRLHRGFELEAAE